MTDSDIKGVRRGKCSSCSCSGFKRNESKVTCLSCNHPPAKHENLDAPGIRIDTSKTVKDIDTSKTVKVIDTSNTVKVIKLESSFSAVDLKRPHINVDDSDTEVLCSDPNCKLPAYFDLNSGDSSLYCEQHMNQPSLPQGHLCHPQLQPQVVPPFQQCKLNGCYSPCFVDPNTGVVYDFCRRSHGIQFNRMKQKELLDSGIQQAPPTDIPAARKCTNPLCSREKYQENGKLLDFCGITCRNYYFELQQQQLVPGPNCSTKQCLLPGCKQFRFIDPQTNNEMLFCGKKHKTNAENLVLLELASDQQKYTKTAKYFISQWVKGAAPSLGDIVTIFRIFNPKQKNIFTKYTSSLANKTTEKYFHGTLTQCHVVNQKSACSTNKCGVCGISRKGFQASMIATNIPRFTRFGKGFYLAPNSSKCHDYTQGIVDYRVMLLCTVASGNKYTVKNDQTKLTAPPQGYDSVYGAKGGSLNYDEIVLYKSESILPKYAIVYKRAGIGKIAT